MLTGGLPGESQACTDAKALFSGLHQNINIKTACLHRLNAFKFEFKVNLNVPQLMTTVAISMLG